MPGYRPPQWSRPLLTSLSVQQPTPGGNSTPGRGDGGQSVTYYFDAVFDLDHDQSLRHTEHPIQSGSSIVDHAFLTPARIGMQIGMSDTMDRYSPGLYTSDKSKSVSAFKTFLDIESQRAPIKLVTRLRTYDSVLIESIRARDSNATIAGLRATIYFYELIVGTVTSTPNNINAVSARPDQTNDTNEGTKQPQPVPPSLAPYLGKLKAGN